MKINFSQYENSLSNPKTAGTRELPMISENSSPSKITATKQHGAIFVKTDDIDEVKSPQNKIEMHAQKIDQIIKECLLQDKDGKRTIELYNYGLHEIDMKKENFEKIHGILRQLEGVDAKALELIFNYKLSDFEEMNAESKRIILDFHKVDN